MVERRCFLRLCLYLRSVLEGDAHVVLAVDRHEIHEAVPKRGLKLRDYVQPPELVEKGFNCRLPSLFVAYGRRDRVQPRLRFVEALSQPVVAFLVFRLVERDVGVFLNALLQQLRDYQQLTLQLVPLCRQRGGVKGGALGKLKRLDDVVPVREQLVDC